MKGNKQPGRPPVLLPENTQKEIKGTPYLASRFALKGPEPDPKKWKKQLAKQMILDSITQLQAALKLLEGLD